MACDHDHDHSSHSHGHSHAQQPPSGPPAMPPAPTPEQVALSDAHFNPVSFEFDSESGILKSPQHDLGLLNALARSLSALPPQIGVPPPPNVLAPQRSMAVNQAKEQGVAAFKKAQYAEAIKLFTLAIDVAASRPLWESAAVAREELAVCLANRSAAFAAVEDWVDSLADAEAVVKLKKNWTKGHYRRGNALHQLRRDAEARQAYLMGLQWDPESTDLQEALAKLAAA